MNPVKKLVSWLRGPNTPESVDVRRLRETRDTIKISQNTPGTGFGIPTNMAPTPDVLDPGSKDSRN